MCDKEGGQLLGEKPSIQAEGSEGLWILRCRRKGTASKVAQVKNGGGSFDGASG